MGHSRPPVWSLLGLFGALLMQPKETLMETAENIYDVPPNDLGGRRALACAIMQFNENRVAGPNYFKVLRVLKAQLQILFLPKYYFTVELVETTCKKEAGKKIKYKWLKKCKQLPENQEILIRYLEVTPNLCP